MSTLIGQYIKGGFTGTGPQWTQDSNDTTGGDASQAQPAPSIIDDPTFSGRGKVLKIDCFGQSTALWNGAFISLAALLTAPPAGIVTVQYDMYRSNVFSTVYCGEDILQANWYAYFYPFGPNVLMHPNGNLRDEGILQTSNTWTTWTFELDFALGKVRARKDGGAFTAWLTKPAGGLNLKGIGWEVIGTDLGAMRDGENWILIDNISVTGVDGGGGSGTAFGSSVTASTTPYVLHPPELLPDGSTRQKWTTLDPETTGLVTCADTEPSTDGGHAIIGGKAGAVKQVFEPEGTPAAWVYETADFNDAPKQFRAVEDWGEAEGVVGIEVLIDGVTSAEHSITRTRRPIGQREGVNVRRRYSADAGENRLHQHVLDVVPTEV